jgi:menaquinone-dependent protoporphyrinogen oxidase
MGKNVLIAYATRTGSAIGIAEEIGNVLTASGFTVTIQNIIKVTEIKNFDCIILGSPIQALSIMKEVKSFIKTNSAELKTKKTGFFITCFSLKSGNEKTVKETYDYADKIGNDFGSLSNTAFMGTINYSKVKFFTRFLLKYIVKAKEGDYREWDKIKDWAKKLVELLK